MRRLMLPLLVFAIVACQPATTELTEAQKAAIAAEVDAVAADWWAAWAAAEFDRGMSFIDAGPDAAWTWDEGTVYTRAEMDRTWRPDFAQTERQDLTFGDARTIVLAPDIAYTIRAVTGVATYTTGNTRPPLSTIETVVWIKRDGEWKVLAGHESVQKQSWQGLLSFEASQ
jgi:ketosteroid isomerase-like protein